MVNAGGTDTPPDQTPRPVRDVLRTGLAAWATPFAADEPVPGADLVQWFGTWRNELAGADRRLGDVIDSLEAWRDDARMHLRRCPPQDEPPYHNAVANLGRLLALLRSDPTDALAAPGPITPALPDYRRFIEAE